ncbi:Cysteate synthase [uncultured archaeon]|nr:Cysteate synthase [uncultured archaeon]
MGEYVVRCVSDGSVQPPYSLGCPKDNSLLRAEYKARRLETASLSGIWRFQSWLPVQGIIAGAGAAPVTYKSQGLGRELGLENLFISFNGYWPERGARMPTGSFKDLEAAPTMQRHREQFSDQAGRRSLVVASAGNTARAFAQVASQIGLPLLLFVPQKALERMWTTVPPGAVTLVAVDGDYCDAIDMAEKALTLPGFVPEGGARNIARRDGMGTVMLDATLHIKRIPEHYFQAVGSGTGGIAAWEAAMRLKEDGRFGSNLPRLQLAQNIPNAPLYFAWKCQEPEACCSNMFDDVLFNRRPPFAVPGGVRDALQATLGEVYGITDDEALEGKRLFEESEEIDILNAPGVAVAALQQAVKNGSVLSDEIILLNITGGGLARIREDGTLYRLVPDITVSRWEDAVQFLESR